MVQCAHVNFNYANYENIIFTEALGNNKFLLFMIYVIANKSPKLFSPFDAPYNIFFVFCTTGTFPTDSHILKTV